MSKQKEIFLEKSKIAFDLKHRKTINFNIGRYDEAVAKGKLRYASLETARNKASATKDKVVANLAEHLETFEKNALKNNIQVIWARDSHEAIKEITGLLKENNTGMLVKSKSMISEELELNEHLEKNHIEPVETDLGEFIVQVAGEKPYHILTPAMHKSKEDVAALFNEKFDMPSDSTPQQITKYVRRVLREKFITAHAGITGANFLVADVGGILLTENEGNGFMSVAFPKLHIVIAGIEKVLPSVKDLPLFLPLLATMGTGQQVTVYNSLITGPRKPGETNGPEKMAVILLDNKRSEIANEEEHYKALKCIRCGACLNACPIYKNVGGYTYNSTYTGPIGSVITPFMKGFDKYNHLSFACTVCGACSEVCPVKIPLHDLLLLNRKKTIEQNRGEKSWNAGMQIYEWAMKKRSNLDRVNGAVKNKLVKINKNILGNQKEIPVFAEKSFSKSWKSNLK
jgi:L-lactate dehydrogenase complex protein LldF